MSGEFGAFEGFFQMAIFLRIIGHHRPAGARSPAPHPDRHRSYACALKINSHIGGKLVQPGLMRAIGGAEAIMHRAG